MAFIQQVPVAPGNGGICVWPLPKHRLTAIRFLFFGGIDSQWREFPARIWPTAQNFSKQRTCGSRSGRSGFAIAPGASVALAGGTQYSDSDFSRSFFGTENLIEGHGLTLRGGFAKIPRKK
jgi:hypothetical protein